MELLNGFALVLQFSNFVYLFLGVVLGIVVGALPGLTATMAMIVLLPLTFGLPPIASVQLLLGVFVAGITAGSVTAIAVSIPGTPASAPTALEGRHLTRQGRGGEAISLMFITSMVGGIAGAIVCIAIAPTIAKFALNFGPPEYFLLALMGMSLVISLSSKSLVKGLVTGAIGMLIALVGVDPMSGAPRFAFGNANLEGGIGVGAVLIGLFGLTEVLFVLIRGSEDVSRAKVNELAGSTWSHIRKALALLPGLKWTMARSSAVGIGVGALPGIGSDVAAWVGYDLEKRFSKNPEEFGKGSMQGMTGCEVANNSEAGGALIPALTFGIPGDPQTVVILGALMLQGIRPGPLLFQQHSDIVWTTFAGLIVAQIVTLILGLLTVRPVLWLITRPVHILYPAICLFCVIGAFAYSNSLFDVGLMLALGILGLFLRLNGYPIVPLVLAYILTPMMESELRRGIVLTHNDPIEFISRPLFLALLVVGILAFFTAIRVARRGGVQEGGAKLPNDQGEQA